MLDNIVKHFEWPLVRKALNKCSPFTISVAHRILCFQELYLQRLQELRSVLETSEFFRTHEVNHLPTTLHITLVS